MCMQGVPTSWWKYATYAIGHFYRSVVEMLQSLVYLQCGILHYLSIMIVFDGWDLKCCIYHKRVSRRMMKDVIGFYSHLSDSRMLA
jgi:hypothetical protein